MSADKKFHICLLPRGIGFTAHGQSTILEQAQKQGISIAAGCYSGSCKLCEGKLITGKVDLKSRSGSTVKSAGTITQNSVAGNVSILCCLAYPVSDCTIEVKNVLAPGEYPLIKACCQVAEVRQLNNDVKQVFLRAPAGTKIAYRPGQYLEMVLNDDTRCAFSIANLYSIQNRLIELHIRAVADSDSYDKLEPLLKTGELITVELPKGNCVIPEQASESHLILLAGSTGFAQAKALLEEHFSRNSQQKVTLYWGGRSLDDLYLHDLMTDWQQQYKHFQYIPVLSEPEQTPGWSGRTGLVHQAVLEDIKDFSNVFIVGAGSPGMVYAAFDDFTHAGMAAGQMISDVFAYAPRD